MRSEFGVKVLSTVVIEIHMRLRFNYYTKHVHKDINYFNNSHLS